MTQKEIRDQIENMIRMNRISNQVLSVPEIKAMDLLPFVDPYLNADAKNVINNHKTQHLLHQWNRRINSKQFESDQTESLGNLLEKLGLQNFQSLSNGTYVREVSQVRFYGITADVSRVGEAAVKLADMFNDLASRGLIRAVLAPFMSVELTGGKIVVVSYIAIDQPNEAIVESMYGAFGFQEGGVPPEIV